MGSRLRALSTALAVAITAAGCDLLLPYQTTAADDASALARPDSADDARIDAEPADAGAPDGTPSDGSDGDLLAADRSANTDSDAFVGDLGGGDLGDGGGVLPVTWVTVSAGTFTMGSPSTELCRISNEERHEVQLKSPYEIQATEVTQASFVALMGYDPAYHSAGGAGTACGSDCPVENVSWHEAAAYCSALSNAMGLTPCYACTGSGASVSCQEATAFAAEKVYACPGYRLPTEAEWERAYRAGTQTAFPSGPLEADKCDKCTANDANADLVAWYCANSGNVPHPVGGKQANPWGLFDMAGNVWEWCHDRYEDLLGTAPVSDPWGAASGLTRVARGGSYINPAQRIRAASRLEHSASDRQRWRGFRCARTK